MPIEDTKFRERAFNSTYLALTCVAMVGWIYAIGRGATFVVSWMLS